MTPRDHMLGYAGEMVRLVNGRLRGLLDEIASPALRTPMLHALEGGKRIRPVLALASCAAAGGRESDALDAAAALELLHTASLVHDDIMDGSAQRRGRPSVQAAFGVPAAVLAGDAMIALSLRAVRRTQGPNRERILQEFEDAFLVTCEGQAEDLSLSAAAPGDGEAHREMARRKTAKLLEACAAIGALAAAADESAVQLLRRFALHLGMAYQMRDDLLDALGDEAVTGKPAGQDTRNGRTTFLTANPAERVSALVEQHTHSACTTLDSLPAAPAREHLRILAGSLAGRAA